MTSMYFLSIIVHNTFMEYTTIFQWAAGLLSFGAYGVYIFDIWFGTTRPSRSSWWILSIIWIVLLLSSVALAPGENFVEQFSSTAGGYISLAYILCSLIIAISTIWRGSKELWGLFDWLCLIFAGLSLILFIFVQNPILSLVSAILADIFGILPTIKNAWNYPNHEHFWAWFLTSFASILSLFAITRWTLDLTGASDWLSVFYLLIINILITIIIFYRRFR